MSSARSDRSRVPGREGNRKHHRARPEHPPAAVGQLGLAQCGMGEPQQMTDFVEGDRFRGRSDRGPRFAVDQSNVELKKMSDSTISPVIVSMKKLVAASVRSMSGRFW